MTTNHRRDVRAWLNILSALEHGADPNICTSIRESESENERRLAAARQRAISAAIQAAIARDDFEDQIAWCLAIDARKGSGSGGGNVSNKKHADAMRRKVGNYDRKNRALG